LSKIGDGESGVVCACEGGRQCVQRLAEMGVSIGTRLRVVRGGGPVIVDVRGQRLVIGRGMAERVTVEI
jgi:ferrous iron transport protein A